MLPPDQLKNKKFCKFYNATSHSTNECRIFWQHIQRAIQQGMLKFDTPRKIKVDDNPFPRNKNMVDAKLLKGKTRVLTSKGSQADVQPCSIQQILLACYVLTFFVPTNSMKTLTVPF